MTASCYIHADDYPDNAGDSMIDINDYLNCGYSAHDDSAIDTSADDYNCSLQDSPTSHIINVSALSDNSRRSSDIDELRISALDTLNKQAIVCRSAECLLNDYGDTQSLQRSKKQGSYDLLDTKVERFEASSSTGKIGIRRGHFRSKSAFGLKDMVAKAKDTKKKLGSKLDKTKAEKTISIPQIAVTKCSVADSPKEKAQTLPRTMSFGKTFEQNITEVTDHELSDMQRRSSKGRRKRDKLSNIFSTVSGEKDLRDSLEGGKGKIGRGLSKIRRDVLGKSMEGIIDTNITEPAFDLVDICAGTDADLTLVGSVTEIGSGGGSSLGSVLEYRDLSAWRVSIPKLLTSTSAGKHCFVYEIDVQRIDIRAVSENAEDLHWTVQRQYSEFYALESKLTEFHGEFEDIKLPPRVKIFFSKGLDFLQSKIKPFQEYLSGLLQKPALKESDLLFTFLTSPEEFTVAASYLGMGKMIKNVPMKLSKEKGQGLQPFIDSFVASTMSQSPKPRYESVIGNPNDKDATTERIINKHETFEDNFYVNEELKIGSAYKYFSHKKLLPEIVGTYDTLVYLSASLFQVPVFTIQLMLGLGVIIKNTFDHFVEYAIASKLSKVLCCRRMAYLCRLTEETLFEQSIPRTDEQKIQRKENAFRNFQSFVRPLIEWITKKEKFESGTKFIFNAVQDPIINKQLAILLFDQVILELFPELAEKS